jgi:hypothetical protein
VRYLANIDEDIAVRITTQLGSEVMFNMILALVHQPYAEPDQQKPIYQWIHGARTQFDNLRSQRNIAVHMDWLRESGHLAGVRVRADGRLTWKFHTEA